MNLLIALLSGTGIFNSLFFIIYLNFFSERSMNLPSKKLLSLLILVVSIKMSFLWVMDLTASYPLARQFYFLISLVSYSSIGPIFFLYLKSLSGKSVSLVYGLHLLPSILLLVFFDFETYLQINGIWYIQAYFVFYILLSAVQIRKLHVENNLKNSTIKWLVGINFILFIVWVTAINEFYKVELLALYSFFLYPLVIFASDLKNNKKRHVKLKKVGKDQDDADEILLKIKSFMKTEKPFLDANLVMPELAKKIRVPLHLLSATINTNLQKNFSDFINEYRIEAAAQMLNDEKFQHFTISSIAYEVGFNSLSTFNKAFKKVYKMTPSQYRKLENRKNK